MPAARAYGSAERNIRPVTSRTWMPAARAASIAAIVRGRRTPSSAISVRSRSHANASTRRGKSAGRISPTCDSTTYAATSAISCSLSWSLNAGIAPWPFVTRSTTSSASGLASSRFGPTLPDEPAASSTWQPPQPAEAKTSWPASRDRPRGSGSSCRRRLLGRRRLGQRALDRLRGGRGLLAAAASG